MCGDVAQVDRRAMQSIKELQDDPGFLDRVYKSRGYGLPSHVKREL